MLHPKNSLALELSLSGRVKYSFRNARFEKKIVDVKKLNSTREDKDVGCSGPCHYFLFYPYLQ